jgi:aspartate/methionine/tyrosine aminotransferase
MIPEIAARAKAAAAKHPDFIRGDQGQVVGVLPEREVYYGPSSGLPVLRRLAARFWTLAYHLDGTPGVPRGGLGAEHAAIVSGATEGLAILLRLLAPHRRVGLQRLHWGNYRSIVAHAGGEPVVLDFFAPDGELDVEGVAAAVDSHSIGTLVVNFPANPTGDCLSDDEMTALAALARDRNLLLIADEVYNWIRYDGPPRSMLGFAPERTLAIGAASKEYLIPGARTAWILSADEEFCDQWLPRLIRTTSSSPNVLGQQLAAEMLAADVEDLEEGRSPRYLSRVREVLLKRRNLMVEVLHGAGFEIVGRVGDHSPAGGISLLARLPDGLEDDVAFNDKAIGLGKFSAIPGAAFGAPGHVRFGYAGMTLDSIERLRRVLPEVVEAVGATP